MTDSANRPADAPPERTWIVVARLGRTRGLKGELYATGWEHVERYAALREVRLMMPDGGLVEGGRPFAVAEVRRYKNGLVFRFDGIDSIESAGRFERCTVVVAPEERPPLQAGEFYMADLVGCDVFDRRRNCRIGVVTGWQEFGGPEMLEVMPEGGSGRGEILVPFARSICVLIDPARKRIEVDPPDGLLELN